jgi:hypothetical protein
MRRGAPKFRHLSLFVKLSWSLDTQRRLLANFSVSSDRARDQYVHSTIIQIN